MSFKHYCVDLTGKKGAYFYNTVLTIMYLLASAKWSFAQLLRCNHLKRDNDRVGMTGDAKDKEGKGLAGKEGEKSRYRTVKKCSPRTKAVTLSP